MSKETALAKIEREEKRKALIFARKEELEEIAPQYEPIVTVLEFKPTDFANVGKENGGGKMYPEKSAQNRIADAAGISYNSNCGVREEGDYDGIVIDQEQGGLFTATGRYTVIGWAQGTRLKPDGTPRTSSVCSYEFNVVDRFNEACMTDYQKNKYIVTVIDARKKLLSLKKFATRRASTGAQLAVIRELAGVPTAFDKTDISLPMVFAQIVENNKFKLQIAGELMKTPDGRQAMAGAVFGTTQMLFGPQPRPAIIDAPAQKTTRIEPGRDDTSPIQPETPDQDPPDDDDDSFVGFEGPGPEDDRDPEAARREEIVSRLEEYLHSGLLRKTGYDLVSGAVNNPEKYSTDQLLDLLNRAGEAARVRGGAA